MIKLIEENKATEDQKMMEICESIFTREAHVSGDSDQGQNQTVQDTGIYPAVTDGASPSYLKSMVELERL